MSKLRIVAGELGGRFLLVPAGSRMRPTSNMAREAIFSILGDIEGARVLDLFAGTGALAIEALSRGAVSAVMVDTDPLPAVANVERYRLHSRVRLVRDDAVRFLRGTDRGAFDLVFIDPPYKLAGRLQPQLDKLLPAHLAPGARVVTESAARTPLELSLPLATQRTYGDTRIGVYRT